MNGDGKTDIISFEPAGALVWFSTGSEMSYQGVWSPSDWTSYERLAVDMNGDGKADIISFEPAGALVWFSMRKGPDLIFTISNGIDGTTTLEYEPSSSYTNKLLPFIVQTLSKVTINDGNGNDMIVEYDYAGANFDYEDRGFWGFDYVKATSIYTNGSTISETWFENEDFIFKGLPLEQITSDSAGDTYTRSVNTYDYTEPYAGVSFPYLDQKDDEVYDGTATSKAVATVFNYDAYGNVTKKSFLGEGGAGTGDERYEYTDYTPYDTTNWIVSLPKDTYVKDTDDANIEARQWFTYEPNTGNMLTETAWLDGGTDPVTTYTYDPYGNVETITDPKNNPATLITYDTATHTFPITMRNPLLQTTTKTYHSIFINKVETETGSNNNTTTYRYDEFGRILMVISPKDSDTYPSMTYEYPLNSEYGQIGTQAVTTCAAEKHAAKQTGSGDYLCSKIYFDGLGRTIMTRSNGPDSKTIVTETEYNDRGLTERGSLPYFEGSETARWTDYEYDPIGRVIQATFPDTTYSTSAYMKGTLTYIDPNGHQKIEEKDIYGRLVKVEEYKGDETAGFALYATTTYDYDVFGNLRFVTDAKNNVTEVRYDSLSRKYWMDDPDMGVWEYDYDANGNLVWQKDAKLQEITFEYDELNRIEKKIYPDATFIKYKYDETFSTNYIGRLTTLIDKSGTTKYYYDELGQTVKTIKTIDLTDYTTETVYDALGRTETLTYPDDTIVKYEYGTGGNLWKVTDSIGSIVYAEYTGYNALGQYGQVDFNNGVTTTYQYHPDNNRLDSILTNSSTAGDLISLTYGFDNVGNITGITDAVDSSRTRTYQYDELDRLLEAGSDSYGGNLVYQYDEIGNMTYNYRYGDYQYDDPDHKHAVTSITNNGQTVDTYVYDANGSMTSGAGRTFSYNYDNRAESITYGGAATVSVYDAGGQRVKKEVPGSTTTYIGDIYECTEGVCTKYIFGGSQRIAKIDTSDTYYYHTDHLGSSSVITDSTGMEEQDIYYYPFGEIKTNTGSDVTKYKFTDQEWDAESGLYYYDARYYDPKLARFISADTIVPDPRNPQALNRYSYVVNNPIKYIDPSGHGFFSKIWKSIKKVIKPVVAVVVAAAVFATVGPAAYSFLAANFTAMSHVALSAVSGAIAGAAAGAASTAVMGGNIGRGALYGAVSGGIVGGVGALNFSSSFAAGMAQIGAGALSGGATAELSGGKFSEGFKTGGIVAVDNMAASKFFEWSNKIGKLSMKKSNVDMTVKGELYAFNGVGQVNDPYYWSRSWNQVNDLTETQKFIKDVTKTAGKTYLKHMDKAAEYSEKLNEAWPGDAGKPYPGFWGPVRDIIRALPK